MPFRLEKWLKLTSVYLKGLSKRFKNKKQQQETSKPGNYNLFNQKITFEFLKSHLWAAANILRGSLDPADYRQPIITAV